MVTKEEREALVMADAVLRRRGGVGIDHAGIVVRDGKVYEDGELVESAAPRKAKAGD